MHDIEPFYNWRDHYIASEDRRSPFYGRTYNEFSFHNKVYNYFIHPQWDSFGSQTLYTKLIYVDYEEQFAILEFIGEWNDCLTNDVMYLKREVVDQLVEQEINKYILVAENVLNFHGSDDSYYEEWFDDIKDSGGWVAMINTLVHVNEELNATGIQYYLNFGGHFNNINWRNQKPKNLCLVIDALVNNQTKRLF